MWTTFSNHPTHCTRVWTGWSHTPGKFALLFFYKGLILNLSINRHVFVTLLPHVTLKVNVGRGGKEISGKCLNKLKRANTRMTRTAERNRKVTLNRENNYIVQHRGFLQAHIICFLLNIWHWLMNWMSFLTAIALHRPALWPHLSCSLLSTCPTGDLVIPLWTSWCGCVSF